MYTSVQTHLATSYQLQLEMLHLLKFKIYFSIVTILPCVKTRNLLLQHVPPGESWVQYPEILHIGIFNHYFRVTTTTLHLKLPHPVHHPHHRWVLHRLVGHPLRLQMCHPGQVSTLPLHARQPQYPAQLLPLRDR